MGYRELIKVVQKKSGFSDQESQEALELTVESIAERLNDGERKDFASQLPKELQEVALSAEPIGGEQRQDILAELMIKEDIEEARAKKQLLSAWEALKSFISSGEIHHIKSQLPNQVAELLH